MNEASVWAEEYFSEGGGCEECVGAGGARGSR